MNSSGIDFNIIALLEKAPSKKYIRKFIEDIFLLRNKMDCFNQYLKTPTFQSNMQELGLDETQNHALILNLLKLIEEIVIRKEGRETLFPSTFNDQMKNYLLDTISKEIDAIILQDWGGVIAREINESSNFLSIDWRLDVQVSSDTQKKTSNPMVFLDIESSDNDNYKIQTTTYQFNKQEFLNLFENFNKIKEQINLLVSE